MTLRHRSLGALLLPLLVACTNAVPPKSSQGVRKAEQEQALPLVRLRLYSSGVGYFERFGDLSTGQHSLPVPMGHLDDALKSLVVLSANSEKLALTFPSRVSPAVARARAGIAADETSALSYDRLLAAMRGEEVEVTLKDARRFGAKHLKGRVVEVVSVEPSHPSYDHGPTGTVVTKDDEKVEEVARLQVMLMSEERGVVRFDLSELVAVRPLDPRLNERFNAALSARIASRANPTEWLTMAAGNHSLQKLRLGYLAETPVWRTSYRLLVQTQGRGELQAWALIHNDTDEVWNNVKMELVDGAPNSFLYPLAAPRYQRRELSTPADTLSSVPQLSTTTPDAMWGDFSDYQGEVVESIKGDQAQSSGTGYGQGFGSGHGRLGGSHKTRAPKVRPEPITSEASDLIWVGDIAKKAGVRSDEDRAVSLYNVGTELNLLPQHSALVPFLKEAVEAKTIVWFSAMDAAPERAIGITNSTRNTLPEGPMSVFGHESLLGEAMLQSLQPGARQFVRLGEDAEFSLSAQSDNPETLRRHVDYWNGKLRIHSVITETRQLQFHNRSGSAAEIYVGLGIVRNSTLEGSDRLDFDSTTAQPLAVFDVPPGAGKERRIITREGVARLTPIQQLEPSELDELVRDPNLPSEERAILSRARDALEQRQATVRDQEELDVERTALNEDLERLKSTSSVVTNKDAKDANAAVVSRLLARHDELRKLDEKNRSLSKLLEARQQALKAILMELDVYRVKAIEERKRLESKG